MEQKGTSSQLSLAECVAYSTIQKRNSWLITFHMLCLYQFSFITTMLIKHQGIGHRCYPKKTHQTCLYNLYFAQIHPFEEMIQHVWLCVGQSTLNKTTSSYLHSKNVENLENLNSWVPSTRAEAAGWPGSWKRHLSHHGSQAARHRLRSLTFQSSHCWAKLPEISLGLPHTWVMRGVAGNNLPAKEEPQLHREEGQAWSSPADSCQ